MQGQKPKFETTYVDRPDLMEVFADRFEKMHFDGALGHLEFSVSRFGEIQPPKPPTGKRYPVARLVLSADALVDLHNKLTNLVAAMAAKGLVTQTPAPPVVGDPSKGQKPN